MKVIGHETLVNAEGFSFEKYDLNIGYHFQDYRYGEGDTTCFLLTKKNKLVPSDSVTFKRAERCIIKFTQGESNAT